MSIQRCICYCSQQIYIYNKQNLKHLTSVFVRSSGTKCNKLEQLINNRNLFLTVLEAASLSSGCQPGQARALFWAADFLLYAQVPEKPIKLSRPLLIFLFIYLDTSGLSCTQDLQLQHMGSSSLTRNQTGPPALGAWSLSHWTTREVPSLGLSYGH